MSDRLTWSKKWHVIDLKRSDKRAVSRCGAYLYRPTEVLEKKHPRHLMKALNSPTLSIPMCKKCERSVTNDTPH